MTSHQDARSELPSVDRVLQESKDLILRWGHQRVSEAIRDHLRITREAISAGQDSNLSITAIRSAVDKNLSASNVTGILPVINLP